MSDQFNASEITPGLAIAAADLFHSYQVPELKLIAQAADAELFTASSIQLTLSVIDWISLNEIGDKIADAYERGDNDALDELAQQGARYEISEDGTLSSWLEYEQGNRQPMDFPLEFWTRIKFAVQAHAENASNVLEIPLEVINHLVAGIINDGIIKLLSGENEIAVPSAARFFEDQPALANYAIVATNAFITASVLEEAAKSRTYALEQTIPDSEPVSYEQVAEIIRESIRDEMVGL
jgi:hypothetical protein